MFDKSVVTNGYISRGYILHSSKIRRGISESKRWCGVSRCVLKHNHNRDEMESNQMTRKFICLLTRVAMFTVESI